MKNVRWKIPVLLAVFCFGFVAWSQSTAPQVPAAATPNDPAEILKAAALVNGLDGAQVAPWHLKSTFQLYDDKGKPSEKGTYEEFWASPHKYKRIYTSPSFTQTEWATEDGKYYRNGKAYLPPVVLSLVRSQMVSPMPAEQEASHAVLLKTVKAIGNVKMVCVSLSQPIKNVVTTRLGLFPTYCFDQDQPMLRMSSFFGGVQTVSNELVLFQNRYLPKAIRVNGYDQPLLDVRLVSMEGFASIPVTEFERPANAEQVELQPAILAGEKANVHVLHAVDPIYPEEAKQERVEGNVIIKAMIGTDGRVGNLTLISTPDTALAEAAAFCLKHWEFSPYLVNGEPAEFKISTEVIFHRY